MRYSLVCPDSPSTAPDKVSRSAVVLLTSSARSSTSDFIPAISVLIPFSMTADIASTSAAMSAVAVVKPSTALSTSSKAPTIWGMVVLDSVSMFCWSACILVPKPSTSVLS